MIATYRPDLDVAAACAALTSSADPSLDRWRLGGRRQYLLPRGREAIAWCLPKVDRPSGSEVLLPALMGDSVPSAVQRAGYRPVTYGVHPETLEPSLQSCEAAITPACRAVVVPHLFGRPADIRGFREMADARGLLLIEDCAHWLDDKPGARGEGATGDVCLYSYDYGKPVAAGWSGALTLGAGDGPLADGPVFPPMGHDADQLLAAAFVLYLVLTSPARLRTPRSSETYALGRLGSAEYAHGDGLQAGWVEEVLELAMSGDVERLEWWCDEHGMNPHPSAVGRLSPEVKAFMRWAIPQRVQARMGVGGPTPGVRRLEGRAPREGGLVERLMALQYKDVVYGDWASRRRNIARIYEEGLDPRKFAVPRPDAEARWLMYPVLLREPAGRDRIVRAVARHMQVDVSVWTWPVAVHRLPAYRGRVRAGSGSDDTRRLIERLLNLPVHSSLTPRGAHGLVDFLNRT